MTAHSCRSARFVGMSAERLKNVYRDFVSVSSIKVESINEFKKKMFHSSDCCVHNTDLFFIPHSDQSQKLSMPWACIIVFTCD